MKRTVLFTIFWMISLSVLAQVSVGPRIGVSLANVSTPSFLDPISQNFRNLPGFEAGISSEYRFSDRFSLLTEINYREKGFRVRENVDLKIFDMSIPVGGRIDTRFRYLEVPILGKFNIQKSNPVSVYAFGGPTLSYAMSGRIKTFANVLFDLELAELNLDLDKLGHNRFEFGALVGVGTEFHTPHGNLFIDLRYHRGFSDLYNLPVIQTDIRHHSFGLSIGYKVEI